MTTDLKQQMYIILLHSLLSLSLFSQSCQILKNKDTTFHFVCRLAVSVYALNGFGKTQEDGQNNQSIMAKRLNLHSCIVSYKQGLALESLPNFNSQKQSFKLLEGSLCERIFTILDFVEFL